MTWPEVPKSNNIQIAYLKYADETKDIANKL